MSLRQLCSLTVVVLSIIVLSGCEQRYGYFPPPPEKKDIATPIALEKDPGSGVCTQNGVEGGNALVGPDVSWRVPNATSLTIQLSHNCGTGNCQFTSASNTVNGHLGATAGTIVTYTSITTNSGLFCTVHSDGLIMKP